MAVHDTDQGIVLCMLKYALKALNAGPKRAAQSGKDGVAAFAHGGFVCQFILHAQVLQGTDCAHEVAQAGDVKAPVQGAAFVANPNHHRGAAAIAAGLGFDGSHYVLVVGAWVCPINDLRAHSSLSGCDVAMLAYAAKYLHKVAGAAVVAGDLI